MEFRDNRAGHRFPDVVVTTYRGKVWMSWSPLSWEAILDSAKIEELAQALGLAREDATRDGNSRR